MNSGEQPSDNKGNYFHRYLEYASSILAKYKGEEPFHLFLKKYFSANKKHGSRDRKIITSLCYNYFRLGLGVTSSIDITERILLSIFLIERKPSAFLEFLKPKWSDIIFLAVSEKIKMLPDFNIKNIFPFKEELSEEIDIDLFNLSFLNQPKVFIRIRPGNETIVRHKLDSKNVSFDKINNSCFAFSNSERISEVIDIDKEAVIQDYNSQRTGDFLSSYIEEFTTKISIWDCCAASGGKSILAFDLLKKIELTVTDTRKSILENLKLRFLKAGIRNYNSFVADLSVHSLPEGIEVLPPFDLIIADVPCSGSGTWGRTPEQLSFFSKKSISKYVLLQQNIVKNAASKLKTGGHFLYITCSVFKKENEENVDFIQSNLKFTLIKSKYLKGYQMQADTLFAAFFEKK